MIRTDRTDKVNYYLDIAETVAERSTCMRRHYGAIIVHEDEIISTGYNGALRGAVRAVPGRPRRAERHYLRLPPGLPWLHPVSGRPESQDGGASVRHHPLLHVPPLHHQRRHPPGRLPHR